MPLTADRSEHSMRAEYHALIASARTHLGDPATLLDVEALALAADDIARAAALAGVLRYLEAVNPFPKGTS